MRALRNQHIENRYTAPRKKLRCYREKKISIVVACLVRDDRKDAFSRLDAVECLPDFASENCWT